MSLFIAMLLANPGPPSAEKIGFSVVGSGMVSSAQSETLLLCRKEKDFRKALEEMGITGEFAWPTDLKKGAVIIAFLGKRPTGGYSIEPLSVYRVDYNSSHASWKQMWQEGIIPLLEADGIDPDAVPTADIEKVGDAVVVTKEICPDPGKMNIQMFTSPFVIIAVPGYSLKEVHVRIVRCSG